MKKYKVAFLVSHPIQYFSPFFEKIANLEETDLTVYYCSLEGVQEMHDQGFKKNIKWDTPLLEGYKYKLLKNYSPAPTIFNRPYGLINCGIINEILRNHYDAVIIHGWHYITHCLAMLASFLSRTPVFIRSESPLSHELLKEKWKLQIKKILFRPLFKCIKGFLAIGKENKKFYEYYGVDSKKIFLIPYTVDNDKFLREYNKLVQNKKHLKEENGIKSHKKVILFSGKLTAKKRPMDLLIAYERIRSDDKALMFLGDGELSASLKNYVKYKKIKDVLFLGFKNQSEIGKYYTMADVFVLPSGLGETWGLVVNEAMCFGLPVVVSDMVGCAKDLVYNGENGMVFKKGNIKELTQHITKIINNEQLRINMGKQSIKIIGEWSYHEGVIGLLNALKFKE